MKRIRNTEKPDDKRVFGCPQCKKRRMVRSADHIVSGEKRDYETFNKETVSLFVDICEFCLLKNTKKYFEPSREDLRTMLKAVRENNNNEVSIEDLL